MVDFEQNAVYAYVTVGAEQVAVAATELNYTGTWSSGSIYHNPDVVNYSTALYVATQTGTNTRPNGLFNDYWASLSRIGQSTSQTYAAYGVFSGYGSPEGARLADSGALYTDRSTGTLYRKTTDGTSTGWVA